jgi:ketosteroid isomerase-like protein
LVLCHRLVPSLPIDSTHRYRLAVRQISIKKGDQNMKADSATEAAVVKAVRQFAAGFSTRDIDLIRSSFAEDPDIALIGTGEDEKRVGWEAIRQLMERDWKQAESASMEFGKHSVLSAGTVAWIMADVTVTAKAGDEDITLALRGTAVLESQAGNWRIQQLHLSAPIHPGF